MTQVVGTSMVNILLLLETPGMLVTTLTTGASADLSVSFSQGTSQHTPGLRALHSATVLPQQPSSLDTQLSSVSIISTLPYALRPTAQAAHRLLQVIAMRSPITNHLCQAAIYRLKNLLFILPDLRSPRTQGSKHPLKNQHSLTQTTLPDLRKATHTSTLLSALRHTELVTGRITAHHRQDTPMRTAMHPSLTSLPPATLTRLSPLEE